MGPGGLEVGAGFSPLELRRLLLSGEVVALRSGEGSGCDAGAGRVAFPLRMSMTCRKVGDHHQATPSLYLGLLMGSVSEQGLFLSTLEMGT